MDTELVLRRKPLAQHGTSEAGLDHLVIRYTLFGRSYGKQTIAIVRTEPKPRLEKIAYVPQYAQFLLEADGKIYLTHHGIVYVIDINKHEVIELGNLEHTLDSHGYRVNGKHILTKPEDRNPDREEIHSLEDITAGPVTVHHKRIRSLFGYNGKVYFIDYDNNLYHVNMASRRIRKVRAMSSEQISQAVFAMGNPIVVGSKKYSDSFRLYMVTKTTDEPIGPIFKKRKIDGQYCPAFPMAEGKHVYVSTNDGIYRVDITSGDAEAIRIHVPITHYKPHPNGLAVLIPTKKTEINKSYADVGFLKFVE